MRSGGDRSLVTDEPPSSEATTEEPDWQSGQRPDSNGDTPTDVSPSGFFRLSRSLGLLVSLFGVVIGARTLVDNSFLTHLATGNLILDSGAVPSADPYSHTAAGQPWTVQSWLISVLYAGLDRLAGPVAIRLTHGLVAGAITAGLWRLLRPATEVVTRFALVLIPLVAGIGFWSPRPLMFGLAGMVVLLVVLQSGAGHWLLVPTMWLWANSHGSYPLAMVLLVAVAIGVVIDERRVPAAEARVAMFTAGGIALAVVGPLGFRVLWFPFHLLGRREALDGVVEWQAPSFTSPSELAFLVLVPLVALAASRGAQWRALFPALVFLAAGMLATRNIAIGSVVIVVLLAPALAGMLRGSDGSEGGPVPRVIGRAAVVGVAVTLGAVFVAPAMDLDRYPVAQVDLLERQGLLQRDGVTVVHREAVGNYLTYRFGRDAGVFIDDRFDFYPLELTADHLTLLDGGDYREVLDRREADVVLWQAEEQLSQWLVEADEWFIADRDDEWVVACRSGGAAAERCTR